MNWHIARNNQQLGVFPEEELKVGLSSGRFLPTDLVWTEGQEKWQTAAEIFGGVVVESLTPPPLDTTFQAPASTANKQGMSQQSNNAFAQNRPPRPESGLVWAILTTLFCCLPLGIVSIVFASKVDSLYAAGDYEGANQAAASAKKWALFAAIGWVVLVVLYIVFIVFLGATGAFGN